MKNSKSNLQDLLKTLSIIAMIWDHSILFLFQDFFHLRIFRIEVAFFAFFAGYNSHKSGLHKFIARVLPLAIITQFSPIFWYDMLNILFAFIISRILLFFYFKYERYYSSYKYFSVFVVLFFSSLSVVFRTIIEYQFFSFVFMLIGALKFRKENVFLHLLISVIFFSIFTAMYFEETLGIYIYPSVILNFSAIALSYVNLDKEVPINTNFISRNIIYIYSFHLLLFSLINYIIRINYYARVSML
jgi:hypothetical protein